MVNVQIENSNVTIFETCRKEVTWKDWLGDFSGVLIYMLYMCYIICH